MKTIIALIALTFLNCTFAQMKLEITPSDSKYAKMSIDCDDQADCDSKLLKWIEKQKFFKGEWKEDAIGSIATKVTQNMENKNITLHFHPANFSVQLEDISAELAAKEAKKNKDATDMASIKAKILDGSAKLGDVIQYIKIKEGL